MELAGPQAEGGRRAIKDDNKTLGPFLNILLRLWFELSTALLLQFAIIPVLRYTTSHLPGIN
jgi:hypothetical protein